MRHYSETKGVDKYNSTIILETIFFVMLNGASGALVKHTKNRNKT
jgi:hypothetical protein